MTGKAILLLILLNICHWLADYTWLSRHWMLGAKRFGKPVTPIFLHALIHTLLMGSLLIPFFKDQMNWIYAISAQLATHTAIDTLKGRLNKWYPIFQDNTKYPHWTLFGFDQFLHQVVIIGMVYLATN